MKKILACIWVALHICNVQADEGMWPLPVLDKLLPRMQSLGLQLDATDIYHPDSTSLKDAIVFFGGGCTGEIISSNGLVLTNHHCGYDAIQSHSSLEHDYLTDGYWAGSRKDELPCTGLKVAWIEKIEDVTAYVLQKLEEEQQSQTLNFVLPTYLNHLALERAKEMDLPDHPWIDYEIKSFYGGNQYYLFTRKIFTDVRLVGAPPSSIGKFGADTDNWMWPRHTGDFALFRIYADSAGNPAHYAETNVPFQPKRWLPVSEKGVKENDFTMMLGFPGRTNQFYTSWEVAERRDIDNAVRIHFRELRQNALLEEMLNDPLVRIQYANRYATSTNAYKNAIGSNWAINRQQFEDAKRNRQEQLIAWAKEHQLTEYPDALDTIRQIIEERASLRRKSWVLDEGLIRSVEFVNLPLITSYVIEAIQSKDRDKIEEQMMALEILFEVFHHSNYNPEVDRKIIKVMLAEYMRTLPAADWPDYLVQANRQFKGRMDLFVDHLFETSIFANRQNLEKFIAHPHAKKIQEDPLFSFANALQNEKAKLADTLKTYDLRYAIAHRSYVKGLLAMEKGRLHFPDANLTMRLTYGQAIGYDPSDAIRYDYQSTLDGVMEKEDTANWEFVVPQRLKELYEEKDYGTYSLPNGRMPVCFCASTHTTGGNSGSPVLNARGELIGINFDRNWEGVGGDIQYIPDYQRSIIVDIRYVLFIIDRFANSGYLLDEMEIRR